MMPREKESFRDNLMRVKEAFPLKELLKPTEVARFLGIDVRTARKMFSFNQHGYISAVTLAREMS